MQCAAGACEDGGWQLPGFGLLCSARRSAAHPDTTLVKGVVEVLRVGSLVAGGDLHREAGFRCAMKRRFREKPREFLAMLHWIATRVFYVVMCPSEFGSAEVSKYISERGLRAMSRKYLEMLSCIVKPV